MTSQSGAETDGEKFKPFIAAVADGAALTEEQSADAFNLMMEGSATPAQIGGFLMALRVRGEVIDEIVGGARTMRNKAVRVSAPDGIIDTCGTGGDASGSYNISTATALVLAACGVPVAKHGNRALSSKSGSADVLAALGVNIESSLAQVEHCLKEVGIGFMMAPSHHQAMRHVGPSRRDLGTRTIFNLLGPLSNPAGARRQLLGVFSEQWLEPMAGVLQRLGAEKAWIVHGADGLDELTTTGESMVAALEDGTIKRLTVTPEDAGLPRAALSDLKGDDAAENAAALSALIDGASGAYRDIVLLNTAAALIVADKADNLRRGAEIAADAIDSGAARKTLDGLVKVSHQEFLERPGQ